MMASGNDLRAAQDTYAGFTTLFKWGTIAAVLVTALVIVLIA
jgi:hypothetical protein